VEDVEFDDVLLSLLGDPEGWVFRALPDGEPLGDATTDANPELVGVALVDEDVEFVVVPLAGVLLLSVPASQAGGGVAWDGSTRAPLPQGTSVPSGSVLLAGGVKLPFASEIPKRPVQCKSVGSADVLNW